MEGKNEVKFAYALAVVLLLIGVIAYAALPVKAPDPPIRIMFKNTAGDVLFDHKEHTSPMQYGYKCEDCHHDIQGEGERPTACEECHKPERGEGPNLTDAYHDLCRGCHDESGMGPVTCSGCHVL
jgi:predicted CXXCH cytochrome family protein